MTTPRAKPTQGLTSIGVTALGIILAAVPLALWIAWTPGLFFVVLAVGWTSAVLIIALVDWQRAAGDDRHAPNGGESSTAVRDE